MIDNLKDIPIEEKLRIYAMLKSQEKDMQSALDVLKPFIKEHLMGQGIDKLPTNLGSFTISERTTWQFSKMHDEWLGKLEAEEKANGTAKAIKSVVLLFKATNDSNEPSQ